MICIENVSFCWDFIACSWLLTIIIAIIKIILNLLSTISNEFILNLRVPDK
jgi:hypothetical protein